MTKPYNYLETFDGKLKNILTIRSSHYDEACILIFVFLDFLSNFVEKPHSSKDARFNKSNFRFFLSKYSNCEDILKCIQVEGFINDLTKGKISQDEYGKYFDKIEGQLQKIIDGEELPTSSILSLDDVDSEHKEYFQKITLYNLIYNLRNSAVHSYRNQIEVGCDNSEPYLSYTQNIKVGEDGWFSTYIPFDYMYKILENCYLNVRTEYKGFIESFFEEDSDIT